MAGELVASAVVDGLLSKLRSGLWSELGLLQNFNDDLQDMKTTLESMEAVLNDAEKRSFKETSVLLWLKSLKAAAYDMEDMLDELLTQNYISAAHKLKVMRWRLDKIAEEKNRYNLRGESNTNQQVIEGLETYSWLDRGNVLGREEEATEIINRLLTTEDNCIIPIVGIGGLGKTTLAKLIFHDHRIKKDFQPRIWVHAADFNVEKLAEEILSSSGTGNDNRLTTLEFKTKGVKEILDGKKFLIVLDDVWNEDGEKWVAFKHILQGGKKESKILVTTRSERVSSIMDATETQHKLKPLSDDICLELFKRRAFGSTGEEIVKKCQGVPLTANSLGGMLHFKKGEAAWKQVRDSDLWELKEEEGTGSSSENKIIPSIMDDESDDYCLKLFNQRAFRSADEKYIYLASIGEEIVKKCRGVPLAANALGGMLHFEKGETAWKKIRDDLWELKEEAGSSSDSEEIMSSLQLSYQHMPSPLKLCFVYCSSYPKAFKLEKDMLIKQWIAQRFIQTEDEIEALQIGDRYVNYLLSMSFLEEEKENEINWFRYEDKHIFLEEESYSVRLKGVKTYMKMHDLVYDLARWVAGGEVSVFNPLESGEDNAMECRYASVIKYNGPSKELGKALPRKVRALHFQDCPSLPKGIFSYTKCLRVLDFTGYYHGKLPTSVYVLKQLRYLRLRCHLTKVDERIGNIRTLESLIISNSSYYLHTLPASIGKLHNLIYLEISCATELSEIPYSIQSLQKLNNLKIVSCYMLKSLPESLGNLVKLETLTIYDCRAIRSLPESLSNLVNLKILAICKWSNFTLPVSIWKLHNLIDLDLSFSDELLELPDSIERLKKLNSLKLCGCHNLGSLPKSLGNLMELRTLDIQGCAMLDQDKLPKAICNMRHLNIQRDEPQELFEFDTSELDLHLVDGDPEKEHVVRHVTDAKRINLKERGGSIKSLTYRCGDYHKKGRLVEAMLEALQPHQNLQELHIEKYDGSMFPSWMMKESFLPNLVKIKLTRITNCEHLPVLGQLPKLEEIVILTMPEVRRISEKEFCGARNTTADASFPSLKRLELRDMWKLEEWVTAAMAGNDGERGASLFPCLKDLTIAWCPNLRRIHPCIPPSLRRLSLSEKNLLHFLTFLDGPEMPLLKHLDIDDDLDSFPQSIRRLTSLETLELSGCESITTFPEWLGKLSQLQHLEIDECPLIERLPQSIQHLTALKRLRITGCNQSLLERTRKETGEDWDKITHIDNIEITRDSYWDSSED